MTIRFLHPDLAIWLLAVPAAAACWLMAALLRWWAAPELEERTWDDVVIAYPDTTAGLTQRRTSLPTIQISNRTRTPHTP